MRPGLEQREDARQAILRVHRHLVNARLSEGYNMTEAIKLASDDLQAAIGNLPAGEVS